MRHLSELEQRLEQAASELRQTARQSTPPPFDDRAARSRIQPGWLVFAAAFAVVILAMGVIPLLTRSNYPETTVGGSSPSTTEMTVTPTTTVPTSTTIAPDCSAVGLPMPAEQDGLPAPVAETRRAIAAAAIACDYRALEALGGTDLNTSFGGGGFQNIPLWEGQGEGQLGTLIELFDTPYATQDFEDLPRYYVWPSAFVYDSWEEIPPADLDALRTIYTDEELDQIATFGSYAGWRIGITEDGDWRFFVAGD
jgi:hypothetical protein